MCFLVLARSRQHHEAPDASHQLVLVPTANTGPLTDRVTTLGTPTGVFLTPSTPDFYLRSTLMVSLKLVVLTVEITY